MINKKYIFPLLCASSHLLSGCTIALWTFNDPGERGSYYKKAEEYTDEIQSAFEYKNVNLSTQTVSGTVANMKLPTEGIGFIGKKNIYFVTDNGEALLSLNTLMSKIPLASEGDNKYIDINLVSHYHGYGNAAFSQCLKIKTRQQASSLTEEEKNTLMKSSFSLHDGYYQRALEIKGIIIRRERFGREISGESALNDSYQVRFFSNTFVKEYYGDRIAFNMLMTPVTLTGDILLLPVYLVALISRQ